MKKLMFAILGVLFFLSTQKSFAQEAVLLPEVVVTSECDYFSGTVNGQAAVIEVCSTCVNGECHISEVNYYM